MNRASEQRGKAHDDQPQSPSKTDVTLKEWLIIPTKTLLKAIAKYLQTLFVSTVHPSKIIARIAANPPKKAAFEARKFLITSTALGLSIALYVWSVPKEQASAPIPLADGAISLIRNMVTFLWLFIITLCVWILTKRFRKKDVLLGQWLSVVCFLLGGPFFLLAIILHVFQRLASPCLLQSLGGMWIFGEAIILPIVGAFVYFSYIIQYFGPYLRKPRLISYVLIFVFVSFAQAFATFFITPIFTGENPFTLLDLTVSEIPRAQMVSHTADQLRRLGDRIRKPFYYKTARGSDPWSLGWEDFGMEPQYDIWGYEIAFFPFSYKLQNAKSYRGYILVSKGPNKELDLTAEALVINFQKLATQTFKSHLDFDINFDSLFAPYQVKLEVDPDSEEYRNVYSSGDIIVMTGPLLSKQKREEIENVLHNKVRGILQTRP